MRLAYSAQACSAHAGSLASTARTCRRGTLLCPWPCRRLRLRLELHRLVAPDLLEVVEVPHRGMHDVHHHVPEVDQHPLAARLALDAVDARAAFADLLLHAIGEGAHLAVRLAARDHHALEHRGHARGVVDDDVAALDVLERLEHHALLLADVHYR